MLANSRHLDPVSAGQTCRQDSCSERRRQPLPPWTSTPVYDVSDESVAESYHMNWAYTMALRAFRTSIVMLRQSKRTGGDHLSPYTVAIESKGRRRSLPWPRRIAPRWSYRAAREARLFAVKSIAIESRTACTSRRGSAVGWVA